jgi:hypothetical protein
MHNVIIFISYVVDLMFISCLILPILILLINKKKNLNLSFSKLFLISFVTFLTLFLFVQYLYNILEWALFYNDYDLNNDKRFDYYEMDQVGFLNSENALYSDAGDSVLFLFSVPISICVVILNFIIFYPINYFVKKNKK